MLKLEVRNDILTAKAFLPYKSKRSFYEIELVFDPGCAITLIDTPVIDLLGYSARTDIIDTSALKGAIGISKGYIIKIPTFKCLNQELKNFEIACHDLDSNLGISGLMGMNFLRHFRMDIDFGAGTIYSIQKIGNYGF